MEFNYKQPTELYFGSKSLEKLPGIIKRYGTKILLVGPVLNQFIEPMFTRIFELLDKEGIEYIKFLEVEPNPSTITVNKGLSIANANEVDVIVAVGGGSSIDTAKLIGLCYGEKIENWKNMFENYSSFREIYPSISKNKKPVIAIPTTAGTGSQCTQASVITDDESKMKLTIFHQDNYASVAVIDPELTCTLPPSLTASTAFDAFTHAFESYLCNVDNKITEEFSLNAISNIVNYLPKVLKENNILYREHLSLADTMAGIALANCGASLPHPLSEIIGSTVTALNHGQALALVYPTFLKYTHDKYKIKFAKICRMFDESYNNVSDDVAAKEFHMVLNTFLKNNNLIFDLCSMGCERETLIGIRNNKIWDYLPMEETETIHKIVNEICKLEEEK